MNKKPAMMLILDGFGMGRQDESNAIYMADTPNLDRIFDTYPHTLLGAAGGAVGLPEGQMGNSEVGHLNIGAGRIVYQDLTRISKDIEEGGFFENSAFLAAMENCRANDSALHIFGLLSDGGVHSHIEHLKALIELARRENLDKVYVHAFLDGRDVPPRCAGIYIDELEKFMREAGTGRIATIAGRYYAMDRDRRWERLVKAYDAITRGEGVRAATASAALQAAYDRDENDEFVLPTVIEGAAPVSDGDSIIFFNFRPDRAREMTWAFMDDDFSGFERKSRPSGLTYVCMSQYDAELDNVLLAYPPEVLSNTLGEYLSSLGLRQLRIAETEKYAHVTFFFNGGVEEPNPGEDRILIPSPKVATYDLQPRMSACEVTDRVLEELDKDLYDCIILNFANADMVGHTGVMEAAVEAIETLDACVPRIADKVLEKDGQILLTADHGNADEMRDEDGNTVTAHSLNPVPLVHIAKEPRELADGGKLADLAPTLLALMGLPVPGEMTGKVLLK